MSIRLSRNLHAVGQPGCYLTMEFSTTEGENNRSSSITIFNGCRDCNLDCMRGSEMRCDVIFSVSPRINHGGTKRRMNSSKELFGWTGKHKQKNLLNLVIYSSCVNMDSDTSNERLLARESANPTQIMTFLSLNSFKPHFATKKKLKFYAMR